MLVLCILGCFRLSPPARCSYGHRVWEAGIALAIWLSLNGLDVVRGKRVLELGSGVGIAGLAASLATKGDTLLTLSDHQEIGRYHEEFAKDTGRNLLGNIAHNAAANGVFAEVATLDWHAAIAEGGGEIGGETERGADSNEALLPAAQAQLGTFDVVLASDCIYHQSDASALAAAVCRHTAPGGKAVMMNRTGREGDADALLLEHLRAAVAAGGGTVEVEELQIVSSTFSEALQLVTVTLPVPQDGHVVEGQVVTA